MVYIDVSVNEVFLGAKIPFKLYPYDNIHTRMSCKLVNKYLGCTHIDQTNL